MAPKIILASESPYRKALLEQVGLKFSCLPAALDERAEETRFSGSIQELAELLAMKKAESVREKHPDSLVIGSDQVLIFQGSTLSKPTTNDQVIERLQKLNGQTHRLSTGLAVLFGESVYRTTVTADLKMHTLSDQEIRDYANLDQPLGCAGGYKFECHGVRLFESVSTQDHNAIIGLPLLALCAHLRSFSVF